MLTPTRDTAVCTEPLVDHLLSDEIHDHAVVARLDKAVSEKISECELATDTKQLSRSFTQRLIAMDSVF